MEPINLKRDGPHRVTRDECTLNYNLFVKETTAIINIGWLHTKKGFTKKNRALRLLRAFRDECQLRLDGFDTTIEVVVTSRGVLRLFQRVFGTPIRLVTDTPESCQEINIRKACRYLPAYSPYKSRYTPVKVAHVEAVFKLS